MAGLQGEKELLQRLKQIDGKVQKKIARSATTKALRVLSKSIKAQVPSKYKSLKKAIGWSFKKAKGGSRKGQTDAKVGAAVGIKKSKADADAKAEAASRKGKGKSGVGIGARNIHWAILGTGKRATGHKTARYKGKIKRRRTGNAIRNTGSMPPILGSIVKNGFVAGEPAATAALTAAIKAGIDKENHR